jgi:hypothetical protein
MPRHFFDPTLRTTERAVLFKFTNRRSLLLLIALERALSTLLFNSVDALILISNEFRAI